MHCGQQKERDGCMSGQTKVRKLHYDLLRILAAFSVVMLHSSAQLWYDAPVNSRIWLTANSWNALVRFGVPIFVMISGAIFLDKQRELEPGRLYRHNILRLAVVYIMWSLFYGLWDYSRFDFSQLEPSQMKPWKLFVNEWVSGRYHLWFLPMMLGIYVLLPVLRTWVGHAQKKELEYFLVLFLVFQIGRETLRVAAYGRPIILSVLNTAKVEAVCGYLGYFVLGYYLERFGLPHKWHKVIYGAGILGEIANVICSNLIALHTGERRGDVYDSFTIFTFCVVAALFLAARELVSKWHFSSGAEVLITAVSADTLGIYLAHVGVLEWLFRVHPTWFTTIPAVSIPGLALLSFGVCMMAAAVLRRIPVIGRYLC